MDLGGASPPLPKVRCPVPETTVPLSSEFFISVPASHHQQRHAHSGPD